MRTLGRAMRVGGSMLAAVTVVAGGVAFGSGTAAGDVTVFGSSTGSVGSTPWWLDEALDGLRPCEGRPSPAAPPDMGPCYQDRDAVATLGNYRATYSAASDVDPGSEVRFYGDIQVEEAAYNVANPEKDVNVTSVVQRPPKGFEFIGVEVRRLTPVKNFNDYRVEALESTVAVDPVTSEVTVTAPEGGWSILPGEAFHGGFESGRLGMVFTFRAPERVEGSVHGFRFTGTTVPKSDGLVVTRTTRVMPDVAGTGSAGS